MVDLEDIHSLTDFVRNTKEHVRRLKKAGRPSVLTVNGRAALVVQDAGSYQKLLDEIDRLEAIEGVRRGLESIQSGKGVPLEEFDRRMRRRFGFGKRK